MLLDLDFKAKVQDVDVYGINKYLGIPSEWDIEIKKPTAYVQYELITEAREWGIKGISILIKKIAFCIEWEVDCWEMEEKDIAMFVKVGGTEYGHDYNHNVSGSFELEINTTDDWKVENGVVFRTDGALSIDTLTIELSTKTITLI